MGRLVSSPIEIDGLVAEVQSAHRGAVVTFLGLVRDHHLGRAVAELEYSAYQPMAEEIASTIVAEAEDRWPVKVALAHRLGRLALGEVAVGVAVAGDHRGEAFEACRYLIEEVKRRVPIWKRERYRDGSEAWVDPTAADASHPVAHRGEPA
jgi:molybdopterin synthase catalytic subunit